MVASQLHVHPGATSQGDVAAYLSYKSLPQSLALGSNLYSYGLKVVAGHGLNYLNIAPFRKLTEIEEVSAVHP